MRGLLTALVLMSFIIGSNTVVSAGKPISALPGVGLCVKGVSDDCLLYRSCLIHFQNDLTSCGENVNFWDSNQPVFETQLAAACVAKVKQCSSQTDPDACMVESVEPAVERICGPAE